MKRPHDDIRRVRQAIEDDGLKRVGEELNLVNFKNIEGDAAIVDTGDGDMLLDADLASWIEWNEETQELSCASPELARLVTLVTGNDPTKIKSLAKNRSFRLRVLADFGGWIRMALVGKLLDQAIQESTKARDPYKQIMEIIESTQTRNTTERDRRAKKSASPGDGSGPGAESALRVLQRVDKASR